VAHYEYSPFGKLTAKTGTYADANPFRFSSEYADDETGLVYYNYRYYSPELGRWLSRDPIEEASGLNLYGFIDNKSVNYWDDWGWRDGGCECDEKKTLTEERREKELQAAEEAEKEKLKKSEDIAKAVEEALGIEAEAIYDQNFAKVKDISKLPEGGKDVPSTHSN